MTHTRRIDAMAKQCRRKGGACPCRAGECQAEQALVSEQSCLQRALSVIDEQLRWLRHEPCTVKPGWAAMPPKPAGDYIAAVYFDDGWHPHWYSETEGVDYIEITGESAWPFVEDAAWSDDWERLGFTVFN